MPTKKKAAPAFAMAPAKPSSKPNLKNIDKIQQLPVEVFETDTSAPTTQQPKKHGRHPKAATATDHDAEPLTKRAKASAAKGDKVPEAVTEANMLHSAHNSRNEHPGMKANALPAQCQSSKEVKAKCKAICKAAEKAA